MTKKDTITYKVTENDTIHSVKVLLRKRLDFSTRLLRKLKLEGGVFVDGKPVFLYEKPKAGSVISVALPQEISGFEPEDIPLNILYEDEDLLVLSKQPGFVCHPTKGHPNHTMANGIMKYMLDKGENYKIRFINRLDMDTTGVLLIGKNGYCQESFTRQASAGKVVKRYVALAEGSFASESGTIDLPIGLEAEDQVRRIVREDGYPSVTHYKVLERFGEAYTLVELELETGRTHQIRVHLSHMGHPIVGDVLYGQPSEYIGRQALHACYLSFRHPVTGDELEFNAPLPEDMIKLLEAIK